MAVKTKNMPDIDVYITPSASDATRYARTRRVIETQQRPIAGIASNLVYTQHQEIPEHFDRYCASVIEAIVERTPNRAIRFKAFKNYTFKFEVGEMFE